MVTPLYVILNEYVPGSNSFDTVPPLIVPKLANTPPAYWAAPPDVLIRVPLQSLIFCDTRVVVNVVAVCVHGLPPAITTENTVEVKLL